MARTIKITAGNVQQLAELNDSGTADEIWDALPIKARGSTWGDEIYFGIPVDCDYEDAQEVVEMGDLAYWPPGHAFCIFFGPTPASNGNEIRPASAVNVFGRLLGDPKAFKSVADGERVVIEEAEG
jgi:uncharacterized protein